MSEWDRRSWETPGADKAKDEGPDAEEQMQQIRMQAARHKRGLQRKAEREAGPGRVPIPQASGAALDSGTRKKMEGHLGGDLSNVRIHTGGDSAKAASQLGARAFTDGQDVHFNAGQFSPGSKEGDRLLAHELTHVVQGQQAGIQRKEEEGKEDAGGAAEVSKPEDAAEVEADKVGDEVAEKEHSDEKKGDKKKDKEKEKAAKGEDGEEKEKEGEEGGEEKAAAGEEKAAGGEEKAAAEPGADAKPDDKKAEEKPAAISAKYIGVGRKIFREVAQGEIKSRTGEKVEGAFETDPSKSTAQNPKFEADAKEYESKLGALAFGKASGIGASMVGKVKGYLQKEVKSDKLDEVGEQGKALLAKLTGTEGFAGSVKDQGAVLELLKTKQEVEALNEQIAAAKEAGKDIRDLPDPPNVREQMTLVYNFATKILLGDLLEASKTEGKAAELAREGGLSVEAVEKRVAFMKAQTEEKKAGGKKDATDSSWDMVGMVPQDTKDNKDKDGKEIVGGAAGDGKTTQAVGDQWKSRDNRNNVEAKQQKDKGVEEKDVKKSSQQTDVTAGGAKEDGVGISDRESEMMGNPADGDKLKWSEGAKTWVINEKDKWVQAMRQMSLPLTAGPSGTTNVLMNANAMLGGVAPVEARTAAIGYLLPIHAHSLVEVCAAAAGHGVPFTAGQKIYKDLAGQGFDKGELDGLGRDGGAEGKKLYPDDPDPAAAGDAKADAPAPAPAH